MNPLEISQKIAAKAHEMGLEGIGFAQALPPARADKFRQWLKDGRAGTMSYLNRTADRRCEPDLVLPGAKTMIVVLESYFTGWLPREIRDDPARGIIASYAWGRDYHDILLPKLEMLAESLGQIVPQCQSRCYVDSGPVLERDFGEQAGLGFIGKNTLLIAPRKGSLLFLGVILTTAELPPTVARTLPSCGSCTRCKDVCPTGAILAPYELDARLCISYLTIEYKGIIPRELRRKMGNRVFGCDDCQLCCPWVERFSTETQEAAYRGLLARQAPPLLELAALSETEYREKFAQSAVLRPKYEGMLRNAAIALGNWGSPAAIDALRVLAQSPVELARRQAQEVLCVLSGA